MSIRDIELEMAYTTYDQSCKDPILDQHGVGRECRRQYGHTGTHASGFIQSDSMILWGTAAGHDCDGIKP